jgi:hypothetical protein
MNKDNAWGLVFAGIAALSGLVYILRNGKDGASTVYNLPPLTYHEPTPVSNTLPAGQQSSNLPTGATDNKNKMPWPVYTV